MLSLLLYNCDIESRRWFTWRRKRRSQHRCLHVQAGHLSDTHAYDGGLGLHMAIKRAEEMVGTGTSCVHLAIVHVNSCILFGLLWDSQVVRPQLSPLCPW